MSGLVKVHDGFTPVLTEQVGGWLPEPVWTLSKSDISLDTAANGKPSIRPSASASPSNCTVYTLSAPRGEMLNLMFV